MQNQLRRRLVQTCALAYANGDLHAGHLVEAIQADAFARYRRARGDEVVFLGADDCHGTPAEIYASTLGLTSEQMIEQVRQRHRADYALFDISFDQYHSTHSDENRRLCEHFFARMRDGGYLVRREVEQLFDKEAGRFLSDRHVRGTCPRCLAKDQYGDSCEACGSTYDATELLYPVSTLSNSRPVAARSEHLYFSLEPFRERLLAWIEAGSVPLPVVAKLKEWFDAGLDDWCISRDTPYFGFPIPGEAGKYFYVWLDAPLGYIASLEKFLTTTGADRDWRSDWEEQSTTEIVHFIGKDITAFHGIFWPAMLFASGCRAPSLVHVHGFLTVDKAKMSKSRGTFILARQIAEEMDSDAFRYAILSQLGSGIDDIDFSVQSAIDRVNTDLVGKVVNIATRLRPQLGRASDGVLSDSIPDPQAYADVLRATQDVLADFERRDFASGVRRILAIANETNRAIEESAPWNLDDLNEVRDVATQALIQFRVVMILLQPIVPRLSHKALSIFGSVPAERTLWDEMENPPLGTPVNIPKVLRDRLRARAAQQATAKEMAYGGA